MADVHTLFICLYKTGNNIIWHHILFKMFEYLHEYKNILNILKLFFKYFWIIENLEFFLNNFLSQERMSFKVSI